MDTLRPGDSAPPFELLDQQGSTVRLSDFRGGALLLYFYPEADTRGCTKQSCDLRDHRQEFSSLGIDVVGVSPDPPGKNLAFDEKYGLGVPLLSDEDHAVTEAYGCWGEKSSYGTSYVGLIRSSFLIDGDGRITHTWYGVKAPDTVPKALAALSG